MSGRAVAVLERTDDVKTAGTIAHFPVGANQTRALGSSWYLDRPDALVNVWIAATEEANGQPSAELVASKARRYKADVRSVEDDRQESADARLVGRKLRRIRRELIELWRREPGQVESFLRELSVSIRQEGRAWRTPEGER